jgi:hypothetical protein
MPDWPVGDLREHAFVRLASELGGSELQSLLLEVMRRRARARTPADVVAQYKRDSFVRPGLVDQRTALAVDTELLAAADRFESLELSPLAPLATCASVALGDQHRIVSALRGTEVVSDPTNVLALECAVRLREGPSHLATSQRVVRAQALSGKPGFSQHFRLFTLASGGVETKDHAFTVDTLVLHIRTLLAGLDRLAQRGYAFGERRVDLLATPARALLADRVAAQLAVPVERKPLEHAYYDGGIRYMLWVTAPDGTAIPLADGGTFAWLAKLASNRRAVFVASGLGAQLVPIAFRR